MVAGNEDGSRRMADDVASGLLRVLSGLVRACASTLVWSAVVAGLACDGGLADGAWWVACVAAVLVLLVLVVVAVTAGGRVSWVAQVCLPVWGDVARGVRRHRRVEGNRVVRRMRLVPEGDGTDYRVYWYRRRMVLDIRSLPVYGVTLEAVRKACAGIAGALGAVDFEPERTGPDSYRIRFYERARLEGLSRARVLSAIPVLEVSPGRLRVPVGRGLDGVAHVDFAGVSGIAVSGIPGSGKSAGLATLVAALLARPDAADVMIADGKGGDDWGWAAPYAKAYTNADDYSEVLPMLHDAQSLMRGRLAHNRERYGDSNFWHAFGHAGIDARPLVVVLDEIQTWTAPVGADRQSKADAAEFTALAVDLVKKGRSAGVCLIVATQKSTSDAMPTALRDVCALRYAFRCTTPEMARAALGDIPDGEPSPVDIPFDQKGLSVATTPSGGTEFVRWDYLPERVAEDALSRLVGSVAGESA